MRQSHLFTKTLKEVPKDEVSKNAELLIRAGFVYKEMAGAYAYLPLGLRVIQKIKKIISEEMNAIGGQEIIMTTLQRKSLWQKTMRWSDEAVDVWFKSILKNGTEVGFGWSHEEPITEMMKQYIKSYKDLPSFVYQFQTKLRNELRAKSGILRGREFVMKDMYSYTTDVVAHEEFYKSAITAYQNVFERVGIGEDTFLTFAPGGSFTEFSHEFQTLTEAGEDTIFVSRDKGIAINADVMNDMTLTELKVSKNELAEEKTVEVGNIFNFGTDKSEQLGLTYVNEHGDATPVFLGSYGIGVTRLMGVIAEKFSDKDGLVWPHTVAPYAVHLLSLCRTDAEIARADALYKSLIEAGTDVLYDDRGDVRAGQKFVDSDLIGIPMRIIISPKTLEKGSVEVKKRNEDRLSMVVLGEVLDVLRCKE
jgi:prolyl-tRNA synthetase